MRKITIFIFTILVYNFTFAQTGNNETLFKLVPDEAFDKMIIQDITYSIFGESKPTSGIKLDISKPEATASGVFTLKNFQQVLIGVEFKGGVTDKNFSFFKGVSNFNSAFEFRPSIHYIPAWNSTKYPGEKKESVRLKNLLLEKEFETGNDTLIAITLLYNQHLTNLPGLIDTVTIIPSQENITKLQKELLIYFIKKLQKKEALEVTGNSNLQEILKIVDKAEANLTATNINTYNEAIVDLHNKYSKLNSTRNDRKVDRQISNAADVWTKKRYFWFTLSPYARTEKLNLYHTTYNDIDSFYFKQDYPFFYGLNCSFNWMVILPNKLVSYLKVGLNSSHSNNISTLNSYNYETRSPLYNYGNSVTEKSKTGTAYNNKDFRTDFLGQFLLEYYILPLKSFAPGFYISSSLNRSSLYRLKEIEDRENDNFQVSLEGGPVFNINSREKDKEKSLFSLCMYVRFEDLTDSKRTNISDGKTEAHSDFLKRNLSFGLKIGVPITLPERNK